MSGDTAPPPDPVLRALADQCVMCGLCLPHCPTYRLAATEAESPRGRIALARRLAEGGTAPTPAAIEHIDRCLGCLSCQAVCPSQVRYEEILVRARASLRAMRPPPGWLRKLLRDPARLTRLARIGAALRAHRWLSALARVLPKGAPARRLARALPSPAPMPRFGAPRPDAANRGRIALFRGCVAAAYDRDTFAAARFLLEALGYDVVATAAGACCGALPRHAGDVEAAARLAGETGRQLQRSGAAIALTTASGCFGDLRDEACRDGTVRVADALAFLADDADSARLRFRPLAARVALHVPCTQANVVGATGAIRRLLERIPDLTVLPLPDQPRCCGAAGSHFLEFPEAAARLRDEKLDQAAALRPDFVLTTNVGCRAHLGNGLRERDATIPVLHPLALLARQLDNAAS